MYVGATQAFVTAQAASTATVGYKIQLLDQKETLLQEITQRVEDGSVKVDQTSTDIRRTFSLTLDNSAGLLQVSWPTGIWLNNRIKVFTGFQIAPGGDFEYVPQGLFVLSKPKHTAHPDQNQITLQGSDKAALLNGTAGGTLADTLVIQKGTNVGVAIQTIAGMYGIKNFNFSKCSYTVPYTMSFQAGDTAWKAIYQLALSISWEVFFDRNGYLVFRPWIDFTTMPSVATFSLTQSGPNPYMGTEKTIDDSLQTAANHIVVIGGSAQTATVRAEAIDSSPQSPTSTVNLGQDRVRVVKDPIINTVALAQARANYELQNSVIANETQTFLIVPNYLIEEEDVVTLNDPNVGANNKNYVVVNLEIPLNYEKEMTIEAWESRNVIAQNNLSLVNNQQTNTGTV